MTPHTAAAPNRTVAERSHQISHQFGSIWNSATATFGETGPSRTRDWISSRWRPGARPAMETILCAVSVHRSPSNRYRKCTSCSLLKLSEENSAVTTRDFWPTSRAVMIGSAAGAPGAPPRGGR